MNSDTSHPEKTTHRIKLPIRIIAGLLPPIYKVYMHFVLLTSKRVLYNFDSFQKRLDDGKSILSAIWHQDVLLAPFPFRGYNIVSMASKSNFGEMMARIIKKIGFIPVRGGSSMAGKEALGEVIDYVRTHEKIMVALTVDGSRGPRHKVKKGIIFIAKASSTPVYPVKCCAKRSLLLRTWDRTLIPLPFNEFAFFFGEPITVPRDADKDMIESKRQALEESLMKLVNRCDTHFKTRPPRKIPGESEVVHFWTDMAGKDPGR